MTINSMAQKIRKFNFRSAKRRVVGNKELQGGGEDEQCKQVAKIRNLRKFTGCENSQVTKILRLRKFAPCEIFVGCEISYPANFRKLRKFQQPEKLSGKF